MYGRKIFTAFCAFFTLIISAPLLAVTLSDFIEICSEGNTQGVIRAIRAGVDVNAKNDAGKLPSCLRHEQGTHKP